MSDGKGELLLSVGEGVHIAVCVPPMQFSCPVSILESEDDGQDDDDPDVPDEVWSEEPFEEVDE
jgi:hypothetical protein